MSVIERTAAGLSQAETMLRFLPRRCQSRRVDGIRLQSWCAMASGRGLCRSDPERPGPRSGAKSASASAALRATASPLRLFYSRRSRTKASVISTHFHCCCDLAACCRRIW